MQSAYAFALISLFGCSSSDTFVDDTRHDATPAVIVDTCDGVTTAVSCHRADGLAGHCAHNLCVISCDMADECPLSTCRTAHCIAGMCQYVGMVDGDECTIDDTDGTCESYVCVVWP